MFSCVLQIIYFIINLPPFSETNVCYIAACRRCLLCVHRCKLPSNISLCEYVFACCARVRVCMVAVYCTRINILNRTDIQFTSRVYISLPPSSPLSLSISMSLFLSLFIFLPLSLSLHLSRSHISLPSLSPSFLSLSLYISLPINCLSFRVPLRPPLSPSRTSNVRVGMSTLRALSLSLSLSQI